MQAFEKEAAAHGAELRQLPEVAGEAGREALREVVGDGEYFLVHLPDGTQVAVFLCPILSPEHDVPLVMPIASVQLCRTSDASANRCEPSDTLLCYMH